MSTYTVDDVRKDLDGLIDRALKGEEVVISRDGRPVVELKPIPITNEVGPITPEALDWLAARRLGRTKTTEDAGALVSKMRDEGEH
jgi:prevent-host-death family protein